jgi:hypothetical protein
MATLTLVDETTSGEHLGEQMLSILDERLSLREILRRRIYQEVTEHNAGRATGYRPLVRPSQEEQTLNGPRAMQPKRVDWESEFDRAARAFQGNGFLVLVDDRQLTDLDEEVDLHHDTRVTFLRLVPLVGG